MTIGLSKVSVGDRPHRAMWQRPGPPVPDGTGYVQSWVDLLPAEMVLITPATQSALEQVGVGTVIAMATHIVRGAYRADVTTQTRLLIDGRHLNVLGVQDPDERHVQLIAICAEVVP